MLKQNHKKSFMEDEFRERKRPKVLESVYVVVEMAATRWTEILRCGRSAQHRLRGGLFFQYERFYLMYDTLTFLHNGAEYGKDGSVFDGLVKFLRLRQIYIYMMVRMIKCSVEARVCR